MADSAQQIMFDVRTIMTESGVKRGELFADTVFVFDDQTRFVLRKVRAQFHAENGSPSATLRGERGTYNLRAQVLEGFGNVVVTSTDRKKLESNHLRFVESTNLISSDSAFTLTEPDRITRGIGFTSDPNLTRFRCFAACRGEGVVPLKGISRP